MAASAGNGICVKSVRKNKTKTKIRIPWKKLAERVLAPLLTFTELRAITVTTLNPPTNPDKAVAIPSARKSLFTLDLRLYGSNRSIPLMDSKLSILAIKVNDTAAPQKGPFVMPEKSGIRHADIQSAGMFTRYFSGKKLAPVRRVPIICTATEMITTHSGAGTECTH